MKDLTDMGKIIRLSPAASGAQYVEPEIVNQRWSWPRATWLQRRMRELAHDDDGKDENQWP